MRIINNHEFSDAEKLKFKQAMAVNINNAITVLITNLSTTDLGSIEANAELSESMVRVENIKHVTPETIYERADDIKALWNSPEIQSTFMRRNEFQIEECARYFLGKVHTVMEKSYMPSEQDMVQVRERTTGIIEHHFHLKQRGSFNAKPQTLILVSLVLK